VNIAAFETSTETISVALLAAGQLTTEIHPNSGQASGELTLPAMNRLLDAAGLSVREIDVIAFGQGPGSFTGVRVACAVAQMLAYAMRKPLIALPSPVALAEEAGARAQPVLVAMDARMGELYVAAYVPDHSAMGFQETIAPRLMTPQAFQECRDVNALIAQGAVVCGSALRADSQDSMRAPVEAALGSPSRVRGTLLYPNAAHLLAVSQRLYERNGEQATVRPQDAAPLYVRNRVALTIEERKAAKAGELAMAKA
jgi:tRNA threonylcarbamoyladenosine biosynthesis protein TsaB